MRVLALALAFAAVPACGPSSPTLGRGATPETIRMDGPGGGALSVMPDASASAAILAFPIAQVWRILPAAYDSLGLAVATEDPAAHLIANGDMKVRRQLGGVPLSRYIDCGRTQIGASADSYQIVLTVKTQLRSDDAGATTVMTLVEAMGKPVTFAQDYSRCNSTGKLESQVADVIKAKLLP
jgi:hypothetical protein